MSSSPYQAGFAFGAIVIFLVILGVIGMGVVSIIMALVRRTKGWIVAAIILSLIGLAGVGAGGFFAVRGFGKAMAERSKPKTMVSDDGWVSLEIPGSWRTMAELHDEASLKVGNPVREEYAIVMSESKSDFDTTLDNYAKIAMGFIRDSLGPNVQVGPVENTTVGQFTARRCRLAGKSNNIRVVYFHYSIETPEGFHQLIMWTLPTKEINAAPVYERVAASFAVVNPPKVDVLERMVKTEPRTPRTGTLEERLRAIFVEQLGVPAEKVKPESRLKEDLGADDLDVVELVMATEEEFEIEISDEDAEKLTTVGGFAEYMSRKVK